MPASATAEAARRDGTARCAVAPPPKENVSDSGIRSSAKGRVQKTEPFQIESVTPPPRHSQVRPLAPAKKAARESYRPPAPPTPVQRTSSRPPALRAVPSPRKSSAPPAGESRGAASSSAPASMPKPKMKLASVPPPAPVPREAKRSAAPPPVPAEAKKSAAPPPVPAEAEKSVAPPAPPAPRADAFTPQPIPARPVASYTDSVDVRSLGVRRGLLPAAVGRVLGDLRASLGPDGRAEAREELTDMAIAGLRLLRHTLDYTAELTVELELRLRT